MNDQGLLVPRVERLEDGRNVLPVPQQHVSQHGPKRQVGGDEVQSVRRREPSRLSGALVQ